MSATAQQQETPDQAPPPERRVSDRRRLIQVVRDERLAEIAYRWRDHVRRHRRRIKDDRDTMYPAKVMVDEVGYLIERIDFLGLSDEQTAEIARRWQDFAAYNRAEVRRNSFVPLSPVSVAADLGYLLDVLETAAGGPLVSEDPDPDAELATPPREPLSAAVVSIQGQDPAARPAGKPQPSDDDDEV